MMNKKKVFIVHGRNEKIRKSMFIFLRAIGVEPIEWIEAKNLVETGSPYIGQILDAAFNKAQAIIVLLTPDDFAFLNPQFILKRDPSYERVLTPQSRPNVIFEAGMAIGRKEERTILIEFDEMRPFSDISGRHVLRFKDNIQSRIDLIELLKSVGVEVCIDGKKDWITAGDFTIENPKKILLKNEGFSRDNDYTEVAIRIINNSSHKIEFTECNIYFEDNNGVKIKADTRDLLGKYIYPYENRIETLKLIGDVEKFNKGDYWDKFDILTIKVDSFLI